MSNVSDLTPSTYKVPKGEEKFYHAVIEVEQYDPKTGRKLSVPRVQKFGKKIFDRVVRDALMKQGYKVTILHNPTEWIKAQAEQRAAGAKAAREAKEKAEQEKIDAAVNAAVAKALAERDKAEKAAAKKAKKEAEKTDE